MQDTKALRIGFIGFGNMGSAIARGLLEAGAAEADQMWACAGRKEKLEAACRELGGIHAADNAAEVAEQADVIFLAVKPYMIEKVITPVAALLARPGKLVISVAWGFDFQRYQGILQEGTHLLCTCPNTPVAIQKGIFVVEKTNSLTEEEYRRVDALLSSISLVIPVETKLLGISGAVSGCGPAFVSMFIEAMGDAGVMYGLSRETAYRMVSRMLEGTAAMQLETGRHPGAMKDDVCSPAGATIRGVAELEKQGFRSALIEAVRAIQ